MSQLDSELNSLRLRLAALEEQKRIEEVKAAEQKAFPLKVLEIIIDEKKKQIERNSYSKSCTLAKVYDYQQLGFLVPILDALKDIQGRLEALENKSS